VAYLLNLAAIAITLIWQPWTDPYVPKWPVMVSREAAGAGHLILLIES
jgi:hypothetical protein